jgi:hypothetical protein
MSALDTQVGGNHYREGGIQPIQYIEANNLQFLEASVVKRVTRHNRPTGKGRQDIEKAIHELQLLLELRYAEAVTVIDPHGALAEAVYERPEWPSNERYRWMAQDANGNWFAFSVRPRTAARVWQVGESGTSWIMICQGEPNPNWRDTVMERPSC